jgi:hypothetical protein
MRQVISRIAGVAYTIVLMNYAAVAGLVAAVRRRKVWR